MTDQNGLLKRNVQFGLGVLKIVTHVPITVNPWDTVFITKLEIRVLLRTTHLIMT